MATSAILRPAYCTSEVIPIVPTKGVITYIFRSKFCCVTVLLYGDSRLSSFSCAKLFVSKLWKWSKRGKQHFFLLLGQPVFDIEVCTAICQHTIWLKAVSPDCVLAVKPYMLKAQQSLYKRSKTPLMGVLLLLFFGRFFLPFISTWNYVRLSPLLC